MGGSVSNKKIEYFSRLKSYLEEYKSIFIVGVDNVSSQQMHEIRKALRGRAVVLMGKNTMVRRALRDFNLPQSDVLIPFCRGNIGFVFTNDDLKEIREVLVSNRVSAPARAGAIAPKDVFVPASNTGMPPDKTSFFQALGIPTKISRGTIEIVSDIKILEAGVKVGPSEATLLNMLNISPFTYGVTVLHVYDNGQVFGPEILDITDDELIAHLVSAISTLTTISLATNYPTLPAVSHAIINNYKNILALSIATDYTFDGSQAIKDRIANPDAYVSVCAAAAPTVAETSSAAPTQQEEEEESDGDMGFGLFD